ncbi:MAG: ATP-dependent Clp protease ATP-binding subunit, partial [Lachnospiraceae bacterium]|nr:ATP-dependent Clp protease ATP-binding subunit [Lachnospiraceae bacterium]
MQQFTDQAKTALQIAARTAKRLQQNYIGSEHILTGLLKEKTGVAASVLNKNGVEEGKLLELIADLIAPSSGMVVKEKGIYSPKALAILEESHKQAKYFRADKTGTEHILLAIMKEGDNAAVRLLNTLGVQLQRLSLDIFEAMGESSKAYREEMSAKGKKNADPTATLNQYSRDLTKLAKEGKLDPIIGREAEIKRVIQILSRRTKNNPCLIGEPGVGKTAIAEGLALRIVAGDVPPTVQNKRVVTLDLSGMVAGSKYRGEFEERVKKIIREVTAAGNVLLFLDEIHTLIGAGGAEGAIDASNILKPSLARGEIQLIGATTIAEYRKHIEKDAALERRFQPVNVEEPTVEETVKILKGVRERYENHHGVKITDEAIVAAATLSERYINDRKLPDKAIDLMDEAAAATALKNMQSPAKALELQSEIKKMEAKIEELVCDGEFEEAALLKKDYEKLVKKAEKPVDKKTKALVAAEVGEE